MWRVCKDLGEQKIFLEVDTKNFAMKYFCLRSICTMSGLWPRLKLKGVTDNPTLLLWFWGGLQAPADFSPPHFVHHFVHNLLSRNVCCVLLLLGFVGFFLGFVIGGVWRGTTPSCGKFRARVHLWHPHSRIKVEVVG